jgi:hypothetical protein
MKIPWQQCLILRAASLLAPADRRTEWLAGWQSELWYVPPPGATRFCLGAFQDALWLRWNDPSPEIRSWMHLESPIGCLSFLAILAALSFWIALHLPSLQGEPRFESCREFLDGCSGMLMLSCGLLAAIRVAMGRSAREPHPMTWRVRLRLGAFLALKIALIQPFLFCVMLASALTPVAKLGLFLFLVLPCRWVWTDQLRRCPVCLRLLSDPIRIGSASQTFLEWYGAESTCSRGHGLLHISEVPASYSTQPEWLALGESWSELFPEAAGTRPRP